MNKEISTEEKLKLSKDIQKDWKKYFGMYVALDDKDRLISYGKDRQKVFDEAENFCFWANKHGLRLYRIYDTYERQILKSLLDDTL